MQEDEESEINYANLKEKANDRETLHHWESTCLPAENTAQMDGQIIIITSKFRHVRKPNFGSVSDFENLNRTEAKRSKREISVSVAFIKTELVSYK